MEILGELDRRLQYGIGMRAQRLFEAALLVATFFTGDVRFAYVTLALNALQVISPRLAPIAVAVSLGVKPPAHHALGDLYFDLAGTRGASFLAAMVQGTALLLLRSGHDVVGYAMLAMPTASLLLSPTVGFCTGCAIYVGIRNLLGRVGLVGRYARGACDVDIGASKAPHRQ